MKHLTTLEIVLAGTAETASVGEVLPERHKARELHRGTGRGVGLTDVRMR